MFVAENFITALAGVLGMVLELYMWIVIVSALISWVNPDPYNPVVRFLRQATEPVLGRVRRYLPPMGGLDLSPIVVILAIVFLKQFLVGSLMELARRMR
jgi:YggT family protein